ncbi:MAG TPA: hypothetical protein VGJ15_04515 [Pirellulales bacterium]|jgi:hypothetical protein
MNGRGKFQFSLANIFLLTFVLAIMCLLVMFGIQRYQQRHDASVLGVSFLLGVPSAIGALLAGVKGMRHGVMTGVRIFLLLNCLGMVFMLIHLVITAIFSTK